MKTAPVPPAIQEAINRFNKRPTTTTDMKVLKALYEKENTGISFPQWLAMKWNSRNKNYEPGAHVIDLK
jgi:hypothetical protein